MKNIVVSIKCGDKTCGLCQFQKYDKFKILCTAFSKYLDQDKKDEFRLPECLAAEYNHFWNPLSLEQQNLNHPKVSIESFIGIFSDEDWLGFDEWLRINRYGV
jgi:hypothetical protein